MLTFPLDQKKNEPLYLQLYCFIKNEIKSGNIPSDTKLPSKRKLAAHLNISLNTVQSAYDQLIEEGYLIPLERKGFFVCKIDHLKQISLLKNHDFIHPALAQDDIQYDFSYHGVDFSNFPFSIWRKLTKDVINEYDKELLQPGDSLGFLPLREAIARYLYQSRGVICQDDQIIISSGTEILFQTLIQLLNQHSVYGIENPGYEKLNQLFTGNRAKFCAIPIDKKGMILDEIVRSEANIICVTPAHQFPSGEIMPINRRVQLLNWANEANNRYIIEDDYDSEFKYSGKPIPALQGLDSNEKVIYMGSLSKSLSPAIRVSYMVLPSHLMKRYQDHLSYILCPVPIIDQKVLFRFIKEGFFERHLNRMRTVYKKKRELIVRHLFNSPYEIELLGADAGLHLLLSVSNGMTEEELLSTALQLGVKVYGISTYYFDQTWIPPTPTVLLGYATMTEEEIPLAIKRLLEAWF